MPHQTKTDPKTERLLAEAGGDPIAIDDLGGGVASDGPGGCNVLQLF
jgi:hypothetical protein